MLDETTQPITWDPSETPKALSAALEALADDYPIRASQGKGLAVRFQLVPADGPPRVHRVGQEVVVRASGVTCALRAIGNLMAGMVPDGGEFVERPAFDTLGIMLDCSRGAVMKTEHLKRWLRRLALLGFNMAMLYTEDVYELPGHPYFGYQRGRYTAQELRGIDAYAARLGIQMIPCFQTLGHMEQTLKWFAYRDVRDTPHVLQVGEEKTYELISTMLDFWRGVYATDRVHLGMDEAAELGRGQYMDRVGYRPATKIFAEHVRRVISLCQERGLRPMIWSDPILNAGTKSGTYYDDDFSPPTEMLHALPRATQLVYWDYYSDDREHYARFIRRHRDLGYEPIMASAVWTPYQLWYGRARTESNASACIEACREEGVRELFFTLWGDDGAYCEFDSALAGLTFVAEKSYRGEASAAAIGAKFRAVCAGDYEAHRTASDMDAVLLPACALWDDPLLGIYLQSRRAKDADVLSRAADHFAALARRIERHRGDRSAGDINHAFLLTKALGLKCSLANRLTTAYRGKHRAGLAEVARDVPEVTAALRELLDSFRRMWMRRNKPFGLEVIQVRFGGLLQRYQELARRLEEYLAGEIVAIEELDGNLPVAPEGLGNLPYRSLATASYHL